MKTIAITGSDGTGKSTLVESLVKQSNDYYEVSIWDAMDSNLFQSKKDIDNYLCSLMPNARLLFLSHALTQAIEKAKKNTNKILLLNGYYYKYFATEMALGADFELFTALELFFPKPEFIIRLVAEEVLAFSRKKQLSRYECGLQLPSKETFVSFQKQANDQWKHFNQENWVTISSENPKEEVLKFALNHIQNRLK